MDCKVNDKDVKLFDVVEKFKLASWRAISLLKEIEQKTEVSFCIDLISRSDGKNGNEKLSFADIKFIDLNNKKISIEFLAVAVVGESLFESRNFKLGEVNKTNNVKLFARRVNKILRDAVLIDFKLFENNLPDYDPYMEGADEDNMSDIWYNGKRRPTRSERGSDDDISFSHNADSIKIED